MKNLKKKGFTIVELVIVIAVIAVLAAVLIPTFVNLTKKANISADQQAVRHMNTVLTAAQATNKLVVEGNDPQTSINIFKTLIDDGYSYEFDAYYEKYSFGYIVENGNVVIVLVENEKVVYPKNYEGQTEYKKFFTAVEKTEDLSSALETGYVLLKKDAILNEAIDITNSVTIVGNNKIVNDDHMSDDREANSAFNIKEVSSNEDITVNISGINIQNLNDIYTRGLNFSKNEGKVTVILDDVNIESHYYAINTTLSNSGDIEIIIKNSTISGWAAINLWSKINVTLENCTIIGTARSTENFGTIVLNAGSEGSELTFKNCTIEANNVVEGSGMKIVDVRDNSTITFEGCTFKVNGVVNELTQRVEDGVTANIIQK